MELSTAYEALKRCGYGVKIATHNIHVDYWNGFKWQDKIIIPINRNYNTVNDIAVMEIIMHRVNLLIDNAATASQNISLLDDAVTREAIYDNIVKPLLGIK